MKRISTLAALLICVAWLGGCATGQFERTAPFSSSSDTTLVVFGVDMQSGFKDPMLTFRKYDPATGKVDPAGLLHASRRRDQLTAGQKFGAVMTGQQSLPGGRSYFVLELPPGDWFLWAISGYYNNGVGTAYSATTYLSEGTIALSSKRGTAAYVGEYSVSGELGESLAFTAMSGDLSAAQAELDTFPGVQVKLEQIEPTKTQFTCGATGTARGAVKCDVGSIVVGGRIASRGASAR